MCPKLVPVDHRPTGQRSAQRGSPRSTFQCRDGAASQAPSWRGSRLNQAATIVTTNREPSEWMSMISDALLAQPAIDRLTSEAHTLIIEGPSYRQRDRLNQRASVDTRSEARDAR